MTYKETWLNIGKNLKNFVTCYKENKSIKPAKSAKPQVIQSQIVNSKNKT
jgi:hypothetical protein